MSTAKRKLQYATFDTFVVAAGQTTTAGRAVILSGADNAVQDAGGATDLAVGIARSTATAGQRVDVTLWAPVEAVVVGTGGATRGKKAILVADGFTDAPAHAAGATSSSIYGIFMQNGSAGDMVGLMLCVGNRESA